MNDKTHAAIPPQTSPSEIVPGTATATGEFPTPNPVDIVSAPLSAAEQQVRFDRYITPEIDFVERITRRMSTSKGDAEDLAQEVMTNAFRAIARFDGRYPRAWLYRIASNAAASRARRKKAVTVSLLDNDQPGGVELASDDAGPEEIVIDPVIDPVLTQALDALPVHYREVVDLVDLDGLSYQAAATELEIPTGTVMSRLHRGRRRLRENLSGTHLDRSREASTDELVVAA